MSDLGEESAKIYIQWFIKIALLLCFDCILPAFSPFRNFGVKKKKKNIDWPTLFQMLCIWGQHNSCFFGPYQNQLAHKMIHLCIYRQIIEQFIHSSSSSSSSGSGSGSGGSSGGSSSSLCSSCSSGGSSSSGGSCIIISSSSGGGGYVRGSVNSRSNNKSNCSISSSCTTV